MIPSLPPEYEPDSAIAIRLFCVKYPIIPNILVPAGNKRKGREDGRRKQQY
jgi:hypothetical protein